jgi:hypothetical protein
MSYAFDTDVALCIAKYDLIPMVRPANAINAASSFCCLSLKRFGALAASNTRFLAVNSAVACSDSAMRTPAAAISFRASSDFAVAWAISPCRVFDPSVDWSSDKAARKFSSYANAIPERHLPHALQISV